MKQPLILLCGAICVLFCICSLQADETLTVSNYYPSPNGNYNQTQADFLDLAVQAPGVVQPGLSCDKLGKVSADSNANVYVCQGSPLTLTWNSIAKPQQCRTQRSDRPSPLWAPAIAYCNNDEYLLSGGGGCICSQPSGTWNMLASSLPTGDNHGWSVDCWGQTGAVNEAPVYASDLQAEAYSYAICCKN